MADINIKGSYDLFREQADYEIIARHKRISMDIRNKISSGDFGSDLLIDSIGKVCGIFPLDVAFNPSEINKTNKYSVDLFIKKLTELYNYRGDKTFSGYVALAGNLLAIRSHDIGLIPRTIIYRIVNFVVPENSVSIFDIESISFLCRRLDLSNKANTFFQNQKLIRDKFSEVLGHEREIDEHIIRSHFARWLLPTILLEGGESQKLSGSSREQSYPADLKTRPEPSIKASEIVKAVQGIPKIKTVQLVKRVPDAVPPLSQDPWHGFHHFPGNLSLLWKAREAARNGIHHEDLKFLLQAESPDMVGTAPERVMYQALTLDLLHMEAGGVVRRAVIEPPLENRAQLRKWVTPKVVASVAGVAQMLTRIRQAGKGGCPVDKVFSGAEPRLDQWALGWLRELQLVLDQNGVLQLSGEGRVLVNGLPEDLPKLSPARSRPETKGDAGHGLPDWPSVREHLDTAGFCYDSRVPERLYKSIGRGTRAFVLLAGLSGTGKSKLAEIMARAMDAASSGGQADGGNYLKVPVLPNWTDPSGLLGYVNILAATPRYEMTPALRFLLQAAANPKRPHVLCLDEMNLARVEHYFAPFLSALDAREPIHVHTHDQIEEPPQTLPWPANLLIVGTLNVDSGTNTLSDKVLDRAFVLEFWDVNIQAWAEKQSGKGDVPEWLVGDLRGLHDILVKVRRHFGYRTCDDILAYVRDIEDEKERRPAMDEAVCGKVLTKLHGIHSDALADVLRDLTQYCQEREWTACGHKLQLMNATLGSQGMTHFWV